MEILLSLPPGLVEDFKTYIRLDEPSRWFCASDPAGMKLGSGGGTAFLLNKWRTARPDVAGERRIIMHAGGQSRRLPAYAPWGKVLTPIPVFRWKRGQRLSQTLLDLQMPLYRDIMEQAPRSLTTLIASGDVYVRAPRGIPSIPEADVVCFGLWTDLAQATRHGVFASSRANPSALDFMLQKPSVGQLQELAGSHLFLMDVGIWLLSDKALRLLEERSSGPDGNPAFYDLYSDFGGALGASPRLVDPDINSLSVAVIPIEEGEFYHYGTSRELVSSTVRVQNLVSDQRLIMHRKIKPDASIFTANSFVATAFTTANNNIWIENSHVGRGWTLTQCNIVTGVPENRWEITLPPGVCLDIVPIAGGGYAVRPYGYDDPMRGGMLDPSTVWMGRSVTQRALPLGDSDIQYAKLFPLARDTDEMRSLLRFMIDGDENYRELWESARRVSADEITAMADLGAMYASRRAFMAMNWGQLSANWENSIFYQLDLKDAAADFTALGLPEPAPLPACAPPVQKIHNAMLRAEIRRRRNDTDRALDSENEAFGLQRDLLLDSLMADGRRPAPRLNVYSDQIVWARSPVRVDLAGGWSDTPPYPLLAGGAVVNMAVELNGQPPLQAYVKSCADYHIVLRSIDLGATEIVTTGEELHGFDRVGSPFSIPKAALTLAGFSDMFGMPTGMTLRDRLSEFGSGLEVTLLSALPAGSGLGTSSILASTVLAAVSEFCGLGWNRNEICRRTVALEQLLTTGGGWQDQYGGVMPGVKLLRTEPGLEQQPVIDWLPERIFALPEYKGCHLLYYTGITRTAKQILAEIVRGMFLNSSAHLDLLDRIRAHAGDMARAIRRCDFDAYCRLLAVSRELNGRLDAGTEPPAIKAIIDRVSDYIAACKMPGAGGGGFIYMVARDPEAAAAIKRRLTADPPNPRARFVDMELSSSGLVVSRS